MTAIGLAREGLGQDLWRAGAHEVLHRLDQVSAADTLSKCIDIHRRASSQVWTMRSQQRITEGAIP
jgi:hypothetical protein